MPIVIMGYLPAGASRKLKFFTKHILRLSFLLKTVRFIVVTASEIGLSFEKNTKIV